MSKSVAILGRQPALGLAELESLYGADKLNVIGESEVVIDLLPSEIEFNRLGGTVKLAKLLTIIDTTDWKKLEDYLIEHLPQHVCCIPEGKLTLGLSAYGLNVNVNALNRTTLTLKKVVRGTDRPCRIVPNKEPALSSAQVLHNKLYTSHNWELLLIGSGDKTYLAQTTNVQDIEAYAARDQKRPKRDARVGMLPPKLAQIIINLAKPGPGDTVLDPFCGTGVVLQESSLMGFNVYGTDLEPRMVEYTEANLDWLNITSVNSRVAQGDATNTVWEEPFDLIASETYLGRPFSAEPTPDKLREVIQDVDTIHKKFLRNVTKQTSPGFRLCIAVPAWKKSRSIRASAVLGADEQHTEPYTKYGEGAAQSATTHSAASAGRVSGSAVKQAQATDDFWHLPTLDSLEELGYTRTSFVHAKQPDLIYHREGQVVGRELVTLTRK